MKLEFEDLVIYKMTVTSVGLSEFEASWRRLDLQELWRTQVMDYRHCLWHGPPLSTFFLTKIVVYNTVDHILDCQCITKLRWILKYFSIKMCVKANTLSHVLYWGDMRVKVIWSEFSWINLYGYISHLRFFMFSEGILIMLSSVPMCYYRFIGSFASVN